MHASVTQEEVQPWGPVHLSGNSSWVGHGPRTSHSWDEKRLDPTKTRHQTTTQQRPSHGLLGPPLHCRPQPLCDRLWTSVGMPVSCTSEVCRQGWLNHICHNTASKTTHQHSIKFLMLCSLKGTDRSACRQQNLPITWFSADKPALPPFHHSKDCHGLRSKAALELAGESSAVPTRRDGGTGFTPNKWWPSFSASYYLAIQYSTAWEIERAHIAGHNTSDMRNQPTGLLFTQLFVQTKVPQNGAWWDGACATPVCSSRLSAGAAMGNCRGAVQDRLRLTQPPCDKEPKGAFLTVAVLLPYRVGVLQYSIEVGVHYAPRIAGVPPEPPHESSLAL